ncbi:hypothetical protein BJ742DRAFT_439484 [Cladochytrium replicatum]|nr:hypothetical protein BJ742DRAFT_439484 [Cladochytrium replicatum]
MQSTTTIGERVMGPRLPATAVSTSMRSLNEGPVLRLSQPRTTGGDISEAQNYPPAILVENRNSVGTTKAPESMRFDEQFRFRRRIKHIHPQFKRFDISANNLMQLLAIATEFLQLTSFSYRDLLRSSSFQAAMLWENSRTSTELTWTIKVTKWIRQLSSAVISGGGLDFNPKLIGSIQFVLAWWCTFVAVILTVVGVILRRLYIDSVHTESESPSDGSGWVKRYLPAKMMRLYAATRKNMSNLRPPGINNPKVVGAVRGFVEGSYIMLLVPLSGIFYLIILYAFIEPLSCISDSVNPQSPPESWADLASATADRIQRCSHIVSGNPPLHVGFALCAYAAAYALLTNF